MSVRMKQKIRPTWANTPNVCTVKSLRRSRNLGNVATVERIFHEKISLIIMWKCITKLQHHWKLAKSVITGASKVLIWKPIWILYNVQCTVYMQRLKGWSHRLDLEVLWGRKKWKISNNSCVASALKHLTHQQIWRDTLRVDFMPQLVGKNAGIELLWCIKWGNFWRILEYTFHNIPKQFYLSDIACLVLVSLFSIAAFMKVDARGSENPRSLLVWEFWELLSRWASELETSPWAEPLSSNWASELPLSTKKRPQNTLKTRGSMFLNLAHFTNKSGSGW